MYRKIILILVSVVVKSLGMVVQALLVFIILIFFLQLHNMKRPFISRGLNDIESLSLITSTVTIYCGMFFITSKNSSTADFDPNKDFSLNTTGSLLIFSIILISNIVFAVTWLTKFYLILKIMLRTKFPKIYTCLCLCCREDKLEKESANFV